MKEILKCIYCGEESETVEHVPPRCFLDKPYPNNMLTLPACKKCNKDFSKDEQYFMYLSDYIRSIENGDGEFTRDKARSTFEHSEKLENRMMNSLKVETGQVYFNFETDRIIRIVEKVSYGLLYAKYGNKIILSKSNFIPLPLLNDKQKIEFKSLEWIVVQEGRFKYNVQNQLVYFVVNDIFLCVSSYYI